MSSEFLDFIWAFQGIATPMKPIGRRYYQTSDWRGVILWNVWLITELLDGWNASGISGRFTVNRQWSKCCFHFQFPKSKVKGAVQVDWVTSAHTYDAGRVAENSITIERVSTAISNATGTPEAPVCGQEPVQSASKYLLLLLLLLLQLKKKLKITILKVTHSSISGLICVRFWLTGIIAVGSRISNRS